MALSYRKRGAVWHCRGTVRVGRRTFTVREFSTGSSDKSDAEAIGAAEEARIRTEFITTGNVAEPSRTVTIKDCIVAYKGRPGGLHPFDVQRLDALDATPCCQGHARHGVHGVGDKVEAAYRRGDLFEKRRRLMDAWAEYCERGEPADDVVPMRARQ